MALPQNLKDDLREALKTFGAANGIATIPGGSGKALEAWVFMRLAKAAKDTGKWSVTLRRGDDTLLKPGEGFDFATSQWGIQASSPFAPCFVRLTYKANTAKKVELHCGLQWRGRSDATHEIDISAIPGNVAETLRKVGGGLPRGLPILAVECKDKTSSGGPDEMRQTLARMFDLALVTNPPYPSPPCRTYEDISTPPHATFGKRSSTYRGFFSKGTFAIARVGAFTSGAHALGQHYHIKRVAKIYSGTTSLGALEGSFRESLAGLDWF